MAATRLLFRDDSYLQTIDATVTVADETGIALDQTIFYAASGGQPGDAGTFRRSNGDQIIIESTIHPDGDKTAVRHLPNAQSALPAVGEILETSIDWPRRFKLMRVHTALHLLSVVLPFPVTGGSIGTEKGRLDFDMPEVPDDLPAIEARLKQLVAEGHPVTEEWITDAELAANPDLVKTMNVKPPMGQGRVRLVRIGTPRQTIDLQPCGGTHVRNTSEIGPLRLGKIEKKGRENRRVTIHFAD